MARHERGTDRTARWILGVALVVGLVRFWHLGTWSLWMDEAFTLADTVHREGMSNPLGYRLLGIVYGFFEGRPDELVLRLPSAILGWLCLPLTYWSVRPLVGRRGAAVATLILAVSTWHVYWSQNARFYTLTQLLSLVGVGVFLRGLSQGRWPAVVAGIAVLVLSALTHPSAAILLLALLIAPWIARLFGVYPNAYDEPRAWRMLVYFGCATVFLGLGWAIEVLHGWSVSKGGGTPGHFVLSTGFLMGPMVGIALLVGAWMAFRNQPHPSILAVLISLLGLGMAFAASIFVRASAQYVFVLLPWVAASAAIPVAGWGEWRRDAGRSGGVAALIALVVLVVPSVADTYLYYTVRNGDRPHWREAYRYVFEHRRPGDLVLGHKAPVGEYYFDANARDLRRWGNVAWFDKYRPRLLDDWARYPRRTWLVLSRDPLQEFSAEDRARSLRILEEEYRLVVEYAIPWTPRDLDVQVYLRE